jgi:hypothetical protein
MGSGRTGLWRRCQSVVDRLDLPDPFDAEAFIAALARRRGRPIELIGVPARPDRPCGLLVTTARADLIIYSSDTSMVHRQHILLHEAAHLVRGHDSAGAASGDAGLGVLLPHLSPALIRSVLGRTVYTEPQEREAELIATMIHHRATRISRPLGNRGPGGQSAQGTKNGRASAGGGQAGPRGENGLTVADGALGAHGADGADGQAGPDGEGAQAVQPGPDGQSSQSSQSRQPGQSSQSGRSRQPGQPDQPDKAGPSRFSGPGGITGPVTTPRPVIEAMFGLRKP